MCSCKPAKPRNLWHLWPLTFQIGSGVDEDDDDDDEDDDDDDDENENEEEESEEEEEQDGEGLTDDREKQRFYIFNLLFVDLVN